MNDASADLPSASRPARVPRRHHPGFTLVEVLIVVVILGILASIVLTTVNAAVGDGERTAFVTSMREFVKAGQLYIEETGDGPGDFGSGSVPSYFTDNTPIRENDWIYGTPIGGVWDCEGTDANTRPIQWFVGVHFDGTGQTRDAAYMAEVDAIVDDGDLATGAFREHVAGERYYWAVRE